MEATINYTFENYVSEYAQSLYRYIYSLIKHPQRAEDLLQEALISAYLAFPSLKEETNIKNWLYKIALNKCRDQWRKQQSERQFLEERLPTLYEEAKSPGADELFVKKSNREEVEKIIFCLPEKYKEPLYLYYFEQMSLKEISEATKLPLSTIKTRLRRGKAKLHPMIVEEK
ncbi:MULTISPECIES: RNA polymerase sigma factor [Cytobacillus]|uniref:RNA polymerase sigma factor n=1 Tax=Cytobacillus TaxID=2675230 RepID=UPI001CD32DAE|nr:RNA polymerase sigma factor [Cytobacillus kochii]MCA1024953.1 RNA polymerase sigma factor [Cytobacillus kochii]MCM3324048.1 RNA polymerase sigma factor [Cytobacillus kochii]MCM3346548.1 RNA polymerase sigma factor [Cytobacillus kochii]MDM5206645.1 RNA polymerase sigma factor [Cytobacillus kochii]